MELKTELHWPLHYCKNDNCIKTVPHRERKMRKTVINESQKQWQQALCRYTIQNNSLQVAFFQTMPLNIEYLAEKSGIFFKNLHQALHTTSDTTQASTLLQALHFCTIHQPTWEGNKGNTAQSKSDREGQSLRFKLQLHDHSNRKPLCRTPTHTFLASIQMTPFPYKSMKRRDFTAKTTQSPLQMGRGGEHICIQPVSSS